MVQIMKHNFRHHRGLLGAPGGSPLNTISLTDISTHSEQVWSIAITPRLLLSASACLPSYIHTSLLRDIVRIQGLRDPNTHYFNTEKYLRVHLIGTLGYAYVILHKEESHFSRCGLRKPSGNSGIVHCLMNTLILLKDVKQKTVK